jgi:hypothetical protein
MGDLRRDVLAQSGAPRLGRFDEAVVLLPQGRCTVPDRKEARRTVRPAHSLGNCF